MSLDLNLQVHPLDTVLSVLTTLPCCPPVEIDLAFHRLVVCFVLFSVPIIIHYTSQQEDNNGEN